ncbi:MAG: MBL fold metallo-hydrolase [Proteobacteria bacterium]|nr:MBL fold metallo-hydrolase [Pseudomonadota bacterium]
MGKGLYAYLQPDGGWGWSNAGLIVDGDQSLLVDTLFDEPLTAHMLATMEDATGFQPGAIGAVVNTHVNGDHTHGNALLENAKIVASEASAREMAELPPQMLAALMANAAHMGDAGAYFADIFGPFDFAGARGKAPTKTFNGALSLKVGDKDVELLEVGPAHTAGDVLVHVPQDKTVFTGDILFIDGTAIMWAGPLSNWIRACDIIIDMDVDVIVPGHGPITDNAGVRRVQDYLNYIDQEAHKRFDAGLTAFDAAQDIALGDFDSWGDAERIAVNVNTLYREYAGDMMPPNTAELFGLMAKLWR